MAAFPSFRVPSYPWSLNSEYVHLLGELPAMADDPRLTMVWNQSFPSPRWTVSDETNELHLPEGARLFRQAFGRTHSKLCFKQGVPREGATVDTLM